MTELERYKEFIIDLTMDEYGQLIFHLANGTIIMHSMDYGNQLLIENSR